MQYYCRNKIVMVAADGLVPVCARASATTMPNLDGHYIKTGLSDFFLALARLLHA